MSRDGSPPGRRGLLDGVIWGALRNRLLVAIGLAMAAGWGLAVAPFDWEIDWLPRDPVAVDAIPDLGENQQIVFTEWPGRSPQDIEDQITYPLTVALLGLPEVKEIRSQSVFGFSSISVIFEEGAGFYWSRSRILEKLNSLPRGSLPEGTAPALGPDATALGQVYWYTLEGRDPDGEPAGGWDPQELRSIQDWYVRYALTGAGGVSEVASIGGFVPEYQIDVDPDALRATGVKLQDVFNAVRRSNADVGARTIEVNRVEYVIRGLGFIDAIEDIESTVVASRNNVPIHVRDVAVVTRGPALRRGALDKEGAEAVGGVAVVRYGANPLEVIQNVKDKIAEVAPGLPVKAIVDEEVVTRDAVRAFAEEQGFEAYAGASLNQEAWRGWLNATPRREWPEWATLSQVTVVPFYDRTGLIHETLGTLEQAITLQILITIIVVVLMVRHLRSSLVISSTLPLAVLLCFIAMKLADVTANIVALSGIAIAIGTVVDMGIIISENILTKLQGAGPDANRRELVYEATSEVGGAVLTAILTTVISFLPVFTMTGAEGKLFKPLAFTKTFMLIAAVLLALLVLPTLAYVFLAPRPPSKRIRRGLLGLAALSGLAMGGWLFWWAGALVTGLALLALATDFAGASVRRTLSWAVHITVAVAVGYLLTKRWLPLGPEVSLLTNFIFIAGLIGGVLGLFGLFIVVYPYILRYALKRKSAALLLPGFLVALGAFIWLGAETLAAPLPQAAKNTRVYERLAETFPGLGKEFMPPLDEGSFLYMPTTMPHASIGEAQDVLRTQDRAFAAIPEVDQVVGKIGRADSPLDPAPISMIETVIHYKPEYQLDESGRRLRFEYNEAEGVFVRDESGALVRDPGGRPFRQWREHIRSPGDIWEEIVAAGEIPGTTSAPKLQPIITRIVMLQSGMRAPMGVKVRGPSLEVIEETGIRIEQFLQEVPGVNGPTVFAERIVGKPYIEIEIDRNRIARYGLRVQDVQDVIEVAIGGKPVTTTVEGRERYPVRVRYKRELRDDIESLGRILVAAPGGTQVPLAQLADLRYVRGPQAIKSEDTFLTGYVTFDKEPGYAEVGVVEQAQRYLQSKLDSGEWTLPAGVSYAFAGNYENQVRAAKTLSVVLPLALAAIFVILYLQFRSAGTTFFVFSAILVAWSGGFILLWLYGQDWFLDFAVAGTSMRDLFQVQPVLLSVAIWVGFLALFGIASDDGVVIATYLDQSFERNRPNTVEEVREAVLEAGKRRIRPCLMTSATTILALLPVLTSTGRGAGVMIPMALPSFGGMLVALITLFVVPLLYAAREEARVRLNGAVQSPAREGEDS